MEMNKKMFDLHTRRKALYDEAVILNNNGDTVKATEKLNEYDTLSEQLAVEEKLFQAQKALTPDSDTEKTVSASVLEGEATVKDSTAALADAFRKGFPVDKSIMAEGTSASAGYLVPQDIQTRINRYNEVFFDFSEYINMEPVNTNAGSRVYAAKANDFSFEQVSETGEIPLTAIPQYQQVTYSIKDYGGIVPVSKNLLNDSDQNITNEVVMWMAKGRRGTINSKVITLIKQNTARNIADLDDIRTLLVATLGGAYNNSSVIYTNDDGIAWLVNLKDENGREYLTYNPTEPTEMQLAIGATVVPVVNIPNVVLPSASVTNSGTVTTTISMFIGDLKAGITCFDRQQMTLASSDVATIGSGEKQNEFDKAPYTHAVVDGTAYRIADADVGRNDLSVLLMLERL